jgi:2-succinyl-6-hydroxy-2,4-cyclohexadiene-1-carboxylate synthase
VLLHGFTGSTRSWDLVQPALAQLAETLAVDLIGHGQSDAPSDPTRYRIDACVRDLLALLDALDVQRTDLLGYSMGGRVALHLALAAPDRIDRLILESASPGLDNSRERVERQRADAVMAEAIERDGLDAFVAGWERQPLLALGEHVPPVVRERLHVERLRNRPEGLANSLRGLGAGSQPAVWDQLPSLNRPVLLLVGARDQKYVAIGERMQRLLPRSSLVVCPAAGHLVHVDQPAAFAQAVQAFLHRH